MAGDSWFHRLPGPLGAAAIIQELQPHHFVVANCTTADADTDLRLPALSDLLEAASLSSALHGRKDGRQFPHCNVDFAATKLPPFKKKEN